MIFDLLAKGPLNAQNLPCLFPAPSPRYTWELKPETVRLRNKALIHCQLGHWPVVSWAGAQRAVGWASPHCPALLLQPPAGLCAAWGRNPQDDWLGWREREGESLVYFLVS